MIPTWVSRGVTRGCAGLAATPTSRGIAQTWPPRGAAPAGGSAPAGSGTWTGFVDRLRAWARAEAGAGWVLPWAPVFFGSGIALYFAAAHEPIGVTLVSGLNVRVRT